MLNRISILLMLVAILSSCKSDSFKIDGQLANLDNAAPRIVFMGDSGIVDEQVIVDEKGKFSFKGEVSQPTLVSILTPNGETLAMLVAVNGDHLKLKGDAKIAMGIKIKGNRLNEDWQLFRNEHSAFYTDPNPSRLDASIEKYVHEHPTDMLSTVLLMADYSNFSDRAKVEKLLRSIDREASPKSLTRSFTEGPGSLNKTKPPRLMTLTLMRHKGKFEEIKLANRVTLLYLWANPQNNREAVASKIRDISETSGGKVNVIDILTESDTLYWHNTIAHEDWPHYWAPGGPKEQGIQLLNVTSMPWFVVTDSTGLVTYSGPNLEEASQKALDNSKGNNK